MQFHRATRHFQVSDTHSTHFFQLRQHYDYSRIVFPQHSPEIIRRIWQGTLSCDVGSSVPVPVNERGVDVVAAFHSSYGLQAYSRSFQWQDVNKSVFVFIYRKIGAYESRTV